LSPISSISCTTSSDWCCEGQRSIGGPASLNSGAMSIRRITRAGTFLTAYPDDDQLLELAQELHERDRVSRSAHGLWAKARVHSRVHRLRRDRCVGKRSDGVVGVVCVAASDSGAGCGAPGRGVANATMVHWCFDGRSWSLTPCSIFGITGRSWLHCATPGEGSTRERPLTSWCAISSMNSPTLADSGPFELGARSELWLDKTSRRSASSTDFRLLDLDWKTP